MHTGFQLVSKLVTSNDFERVIAVISPKVVAFGINYVKLTGARSIISATKV